jgi:hypothetical protein
VRFYADRARRIGARAAAAELRRRLRDAAALAPGAARHGALGGLLVSAGELTQGIADAERAGAGVDGFGPGEQAAGAVTLAVARALWASWRSGGAAAVPPATVADRLLAAPLPDELSVRRAEGFALYGVYPEAYAAAARALEGAALRVVGVRSVGTALAAMVAAGAGAAAQPVSVRPVGHPFRRELGLAPALARALAAAPGPIAIADEGPGLSGSSFLAVAEGLAGLGIPAARVHLFPSHPGPPGAAGGPGIRSRYAGLTRHHVPFEALFLSDAPLALGRLVEDVVGPVDGPAVDLSAGAWRRELLGARPWPPSEGWRERRKYLVRAGGRPWLARFVGLGDAGVRALARARTLAGAGLVPAPAGLRHGFLVEALELDAAPLPLAPIPRARLLAAVRRHLTFVAARFPAGAGQGATPRELAGVAAEGACEQLGGDAGAALGRLAARWLPEVERLARPVEVDGRVQRWEWLVRRDGTVVKADALDHHADHALVGCQDALWDVAGAAVELGLSPGEAAALAGAVRDVSPGAPPRCLPFYVAAYTAFEAGRWAAAADEATIDPDEARRRRGEAVRLADALRRTLRDGSLPAAGARDTPGVLG